MRFISLFALFALACVGAWAPERSMADETAIAPLLTSQELSALLASDTDVKVLDTRPEAEFAEGHIPGATWLDINGWYRASAEQTGLTNVTQWKKRTGSLGLTREQRLVVVGGPLPNSARAWWLLRYLGFRQTQLLDGGHADWVASGGKITSELNSVTESNPELELQSSMLATIDDVLPDALKKLNASVLDNRSDAEYSGARGIGARTGHMPAACHVEWQQFVGDDGKFLPVEQIKQKLVESGITNGNTVIAYCQTGGRSSVGALALEIAGFEGVRNYYAGWGQYADFLQAPVEK